MVSTSDKVILAEARLKDALDDLKKFHWGPMGDRALRLMSASRKATDAAALLDEATR